MISGRVIIPFPAPGPGTGKESLSDTGTPPCLIWLQVVLQLLSDVCSGTSCYGQWEQTRRHRVKQKVTNVWECLLCASTVDSLF